MKNLGKYMAKYWYLYLFAMVCLILGILLDVAAPRVIGRIIDDVIVGGNHAVLMGLLASLFLLGTGRGLFKYLQEFTGDVIGLRISVDIRRKLFAHIESMSMGFFEKNNTGELMARVKEDVERIWEAVGFMGLLCVEAFAHTVIVILCMVQISPQLTLIPLCIMPIVGVIAVRLEKNLDKVYDDISEENARLNTVAQENLTGVRTVKAFSRERYEIEKFRKRNGHYYNLNMSLAKTMAKYNPNISFLTKTLLILSVTVGGAFVVQGSISLGQLGSFIEYANNIVWPMEILGWVTNSMAAAVASNKKINRILDETPQIVSPKSPETPETIRGRLEFRHVSLTLEGQTILKDVDFTLPAGKTLGIMGMTGSGKTTVVNLIERFYDTTEGAVLLDGVDVRRMNLQKLRACVAVVMQDVFLFSDTVGENIRIGSRDWMEARHVEQAAQAADAHGFVSRLPDGYDTETEHEIQKQLESLSGMTKVVIAHRISAVRHADEILILQDGQIAERGTHESLMQQKGLYYDTYVAQYEEPDETKGAAVSGQPKAEGPAAGSGSAGR